ncbi:hypothetical protein NH8B_2783 [Pseudogulbenkiania sp. NH8B]|uniref:hypothetical protein n=1 Tax=Pseudogulbenkiania sp. (strain NH8B) TaxID=748280 RepID=UPI0002279BEF|nr:hypothetical protein [Pseudogulbenkiania sp. NH8B]BAK77576.1 hypothetical protein NH8B_2783 [Pseudogulbenkiania sp. NH8B]
MLKRLVDLFLSPRHGSAKPRRQLQAELERVVEMVEPRLRLVTGYPRVLLRGMARTLDFAEQLTQDLPEVLELSWRGFTSDRRLGMFFSSPASLLDLLHTSSELDAFFARPGNGDVAFCLLIMQRSDNQRLGMVSQNGEVVAEVPQLVVSFDNHRLTLPSATLDEFVPRLAERGVERLTEVIARRLRDKEAQRVELESELLRVELKLKTLRAPGQLVVDAMADQGPALPDSPQALQSRFEAVRTDLAALKAELTLDGKLREVRQILEHPADYFSSRSVTLNLDRMGVLQPDDESGNGHPICFEEVLLGEMPPVRRVVVPARVTRQAIRELEENFGTG